MCTCGTNDIRQNRNANHRPSARTVALHVARIHICTYLPFCIAPAGFAVLFFRFLLMQRPLRSLSACVHAVCLLSMLHTCVVCCIACMFCWIACRRCNGRCVRSAQCAKMLSIAKWLTARRTGARYYTLEQTVAFRPPPPPPPPPPPHRTALRTLSVGCEHYTSCLAALYCGNACETNSRLRCACMAWLGMGMA